MAAALALFMIDVALRRLVVARGDFEVWREAVRPEYNPNGSIKLLDGARDALDKGRQVYALELTYKFTQEKKGKVTPMVRV